MAGEWTFVLGLKAEFNIDHPWSEDHVLHHVAVSRERSDKWDSELIADGCFPLHKQARNLKHHVFCVVRHNPIEVGSSPRVVVLMDERFDLNNRRWSSRGGHGCSFNPRLFAHCWVSHSILG